jgi:hypothetical protein
MNATQREYALDCIKQLRNPRLSAKDRADLLSFLERIIDSACPTPKKGRSKS